MNVSLCSLLKIWNLNKCCGVVGVFNCQGAGWCKIEKKNRIHCETPGTLSGSICTSDVDLIAQVAGADWSGDAIVYAYRSGNSFCFFWFYRSGNLIWHKISDFQYRCYCIGY